jgi:hypothetical protein
MMMLSTRLPRAELLAKGFNGTVPLEAWRASDATGPSMRAADLPGGIYALRFSGYGNGTQIRVEAPAP